MGFLLKLFANSLVLITFANVFPSSVSIQDWTSAIVAAFVLAILNSFLKPVLKIIGFPITILTFGLFTLVINAVIVHLTDLLVKGITIHGVGWTFVITITLSLIQIWLTPKLERD
ncbi:MAG: phage holin family protein [Lactobacillaceae bacterium]|jgi:putative membrane protein|nr:phage holin family protein [Lactobacillaceae bacterium]